MSYWPYQGGGPNAEKRAVLTAARKLIDELNADHITGALGPTEFTRTTESISFDDSIVVFKKGNVAWKDHLCRGAGHTPMES